MKKFFTTIALCLCLCLSITFTGCQKHKTIDASVYFNPAVDIEVYNEKTTFTTLMSLTDDSPSELKKYLSFKITADNKWLYGMYIEEISFCLFSETSVTDVEFDISLTGTQNGSQAGGTSTKLLSIINYPVTLKANTGILITIPVNDTIELYESNSILTIKLSDTYTDPNFTYSLYNLKISGYHQS